MSGWVPIPQAAIAAVVGSVGRVGRGALLELYDVADRTGYAPRLFTEESLSHEWGVGRSDVRAILASLVAVGCVTVERAKPRSKQKSTLVVLRGTQLEGNQRENQTRAQTVEPPGPIREDCKPDGKPDGKPARAVEIARAAEQTQTRVFSPPTPPPGGDAGEGVVLAEGPTARVVLHSSRPPTEGHDPIVVAELLALQLPEGNEPNGRDRRAVESAIRLGRTPAFLQSLWRHARNNGVQIMRWGVILGPKMEHLRASHEALDRERHRERARLQPVEVPEIAATVRKPPIRRESLP